MKVFISAGEASGDAHAADLIRELKTRVDLKSCWGMGGSRMRAVGFKAVVDSETQASVMGITEVFLVLPRLVKAFFTLLRIVRKETPDVAVLVDFQEFHFLLMRVLKFYGVPIVYYICPKVWACRSGRVKTLSRYVDEIASILPFESEFFAKRGVCTKYVGHPLLAYDWKRNTREKLLSDCNIENNDSLLLALLPGSRDIEVQQLLKPMREAAEILRGKFPSLRVILPLAPGISREKLVELSGEIPDWFCVIEGRTQEVLRAADFGCIASGTAVLEAALAKLPICVVYKVSPLTFFIGKQFVKLDYISLPNLIANKKVFTELIQQDCSISNIVNVLESLLPGKKSREQCIDGILEINRLLKKGDCNQTSTHVAELVEEVCFKNQALLKKCE